MAHVGLVSNFGLKTNPGRYKVPREDLPTIAERALGGKYEIHGDVVSLPGEVVFLSMTLAHRILESLYN